MLQIGLIFQGSKQKEKIIGLLDSIYFLKLEPYYAAKEVGIIYKQLRTKGITIRKPNDCLITFFAVFFNLKIVHNDTDFGKIGKEYPSIVY